MAKKKKKTAKKQKPLKLTPSRKARLIVGKILEYAEAGGMEAEDCGVAYEAIDNCLMAVGDDPDVALSGLVEQIQTILNAKEWKQ